MAGTRDILGKSAIATVGVVLLKVLFAGASVKLGEQAYSFGTIDAGMVAALLTPTLGAYVASLHERFEDEGAAHVPTVAPVALIAPIAPIAPVAPVAPIAPIAPVA
jgi:hypothetical protein